jgi:methylmalonyl-CoA mutase
VQADILKEDQGQNTCIFSTEFALRCMADIQSWFIDHEVRNFYSVSISGYHMAEAGANPISQLAFTLANGFTYVEAYLARGMAVDDFAPNLSFFFSNGMDAEYTVLGRVARRIWAVAMRDRYGAGERSQKLKYHVQTSGRSLHAQEMDFNDIRTTLQALCAIYDNANSLHTNAYDEAVTTPSAESVRRALAIQMIIDREWGLADNENPLQGSYVVDELTDLVEEAVLVEFDRINARGGVLGAMETGYQRGPHPGRVDAVRAQEARRQPADRRREHLPGTGRRRRHPHLPGAGPRDRRREAEPARPARRLPQPPPRAGTGGAGPAQADRDQRRQRLRRPHGHRPRLLPRPDQRRVLRGRRTVPPQRLSRLSDGSGRSEDHVGRPAGAGGRPARRPAETSGRRS